MKREAKLPKQQTMRIIKEQKLKAPKKKKKLRKKRTQRENKLVDLSLERPRVKEPLAK
jgi:hypothetical protein